MFGNVVYGSWKGKDAGKGEEIWNAVSESFAQSSSAGFFVSPVLFWILCRTGSNTDKLRVCS
jgi:hypothetical protein